MNKDFRITTDALDHPKLVKLGRICGDHGIICLFRIWGFTARYHPKGTLNEMTGEDIEIAARWTGEPGKLFENLLKLKLIEKKGSSYRIHDWKEHNSFAYYAPERSAQARHAVKVREELKHGKRSSVRSSDRSSPLPSPNPSPLPIPKETNLPSKSDGGKKKPAVKAKKKSLPIEERAAHKPGSKLVKFWHVKYLAIHKSRYSGDIVKMGGQITTLLRRHTMEDLACAMDYLLSDHEHGKFHKHNFDHFTKKASDYIIEAKKAGYEYAD